MNVIYEEAINSVKSETAGCIGSDDLKQQVASPCVHRVLRRILELRRYPEFARLLWWRTYVPWRVRSKGVAASSTVSYFGMPVVSIAGGSSIVIGPNCSLCSVSDYTALGVNHPVVLRTLRSRARITIGSDTGISGGVICAANEVVIGSNVLLGANVTIVDTDFHATAPGGRRYNDDPGVVGSVPITIGDNVFVGMGAIILKGVTIGANSVIGAGSVISRDIPPNSIAAGNPARVIKTLSEG